MAPRPASVAPPPLAPAAAPKGKPARWEDEPPSGGWDNADTVTNFPEPSDLPEPTPRVLPPVEPTPAPAAAAASSAVTAGPTTAASPGTMRGPYQTSPGVGGPPAGAPAPLPAAGAPPPAPAVKAVTATQAMASTAGLGSAMREEVWAIVRAAVEEAVGPLVARQRELEARLARVPQGAPQASPAAPAAPPAQAAAASAASRLASIPITLGPSLAPPAFKPEPQGVPSFESSSADRPRSGSTSAHPVGPRPSMQPQGFGLPVMTVERPTLDLDAVGPVDVDGFDGGRRKKTVARVVVVLMLLVIVGAVGMMVLSYN